MSTLVHFVDVGQGNMTLIQCDDGSVFVFDCNLTAENKDRVLSYLADAIGWGSEIDAFICSHRDADHMRGVRELHSHFPIRKIWDSNYPGTSTDTSEYRDYMTLRREIGASVKRRLTRQDFGCTRLRYLSAADERLPDNPNAQGIVLKVEQRSLDLNQVCASAMLTGDSDAETWRGGILKDYSRTNLSCDILLAGHHGSITFFDDPADDRYYYVEHVKAMAPAMTIVSVGPNPHSHPDSKALELYAKYSSGSNKGNKVHRTDKQGTMELLLKDDGGWSLKVGL